jgi:protein-L-isoaspartate(D-aspartate) O-methyltransferase
MVSEKDRLIKNLMAEGYLKTEKIINAFRDVPREEFVLSGDKRIAYADYPLQIGGGQTISAPHMVAIMTELLDPQKTDKVLEIGAGSGYQAAILSNLVKNIYTVEIDPVLADMASENLRRAGYKNVQIITGDGSLGYPKQKPYDKIIVTCATPKIFDAWKSQIKNNGMILAPVNSGFYQTLTMLIKKGSGFEKTVHGGCAFVPLRKQAI